jgi:hypothetical protein
MKEICETVMTWTGRTSKKRISFNLYQSFLFSLPKKKKRLLLNPKRNPKRNPKCVPMILPHCTKDPERAKRLSRRMKG